MLTHQRDALPSVNRSDERRAHAERAAGVLDYAYWLSR